MLMSEREFNSLYLIFDKVFAEVIPFALQLQDPAFAKRWRVNDVFNRLFNTFYQVTSSTIECKLCQGNTVLTLVFFKEDLCSPDWKLALENRFKCVGRFAL